MSVPELAQLEGGPLELDRRRAPVLSPSISKPTVRSSVGLRGRAHRQCYLRKKETAIPIIIDILHPKSTYNRYHVSVFFPPDARETYSTIPNSTRSYPQESRQTSPLQEFYLYELS